MKVVGVSVGLVYRWADRTFLASSVALLLQHNAIESCTGNDFVGFSKFQISNKEETGSLCRHPHDVFAVHEMPVLKICTIDAQLCYLRQIQLTLDVDF